MASSTAGGTCPRKVPKEVEAAAAKEVEAAMRTEDGDRLEMVGDEMPPDPNQEPIE
jgi:hypothetical protein